MKIYKVSKFNKYLSIIGSFVADCCVFFIFPYVLLLPKQYVHLDVLLLGIAGIIVLYYKVDRTYYPFYFKLYRNKVHLKYYKQLILRPLLMSEFIDVMLDFKDIEKIKFEKDEWGATLYLYLANNGYRYITVGNSSMLFKFYTDLNQALEEYRKNEN